MQSAPWYLSIEIRGMFTVVIVIVIFIVMRIIKEKSSKIFLAFMLIHYVYGKKAALDDEGSER